MLHPQPHTLALNIFIIIVALTAITGFVLTILWFAIYLYQKRQVKGLLKEAAQNSSVNADKISGFETIQGVKLHYTVEGSGPDIVLIHGIAANVYCWRFLAPLLAHTHRVWCVDLQGFGLSDKPLDRNYSFADQGELLFGLMDFNHVKEFTVVGHSMGGAIACQMAIHDPKRVKHLILLNSAHNPELFRRQLTFLKILIRLAPYLLPVLSPFVNRATVKQFIRTLYGGIYKPTDEDVNAYLLPYISDGKGYKSLFKAFSSLMEHDLVKNLKSLNVPILILVGKKDHVMPWRFGEQLHRDIPSSQLFIHEGTGHNIQEEVPEWIAIHINNFLNAK